MSKSKVYIRDLTKDDLDKYVDLVKDDELIKKYIPYFYKIDKKSYEELLEEQERYGNKINGIFTNDNQIVGVIAIEQAFLPEGVAEASFFIGEKSRNMGYAKEALAQVVHKLQYGDYDKLYFQIAQNNENSKKFITHSFGAKLENTYEEDEMYSIDLISKKKAVLIENDLAKAIMAFHDIDDRTKRENYVKEYTLEFCEKNQVEPRSALSMVEKVIEERRKNSMFQYGYYDKLANIVFPTEKAKSKKNKKGLER